ncbi:MAG: hypothetical protein KJ065_25850 [Anaerolineae bacterium]|nr:hypothetical protein [Anaerolineae bacterium]
MRLYSTGKYGLDRIAYRMNKENWAFRDRTNTPRALNSDDVRRVISNWAEYGGIVFEKGTKWRPAYETLNLDELPFRSDRAVFPIELLRAVAEVRMERTRKPSDHGKNHETRFYPLAGVLYCAHCEQLAESQEDPRLRSPLSGQFANGILRYRHKPGVKCGIHNRSVPSAELEQDFIRLMGLLMVKPEVEHLMLEIAIQADNGRQVHEQRDFEQEKTEALALCYRRIEAAVNLYKEGTIDKAEYLRLREQNEREIAHWESRTSETEQLGLEFALCVEAVDKIHRLWTISSDEDRQGLVRNLFSSVTYDLDRRRITDFRLKPWAGRFLTVRAGLHELEQAANVKENAPQQDRQGACTELLHTGLLTIPLPSLQEAVFTLIERLYAGISRPDKAITGKSQPKTERNNEVKRLDSIGWTVPDIARYFDVSIPRVYQILKGQ